jgi:hypothetical protein
MSGHFRLAARAQVDAHCQDEEEQDEEVEVSRAALVAGDIRAPYVPDNICSY